MWVFFFGLVAEKRVDRCGLLLTADTLPFDPNVLARIITSYFEFCGQRRGRAYHTGAGDRLSENLIVGGQAGERRADCLELRPGGDTLGHGRGRETIGLWKNHIKRDGGRTSGFELGDEGSRPGPLAEGGQRSLVGVDDPEWGRGAITPRGGTLHGVEGEQTRVRHGPRIDVSKGAQSDQKADQEHMGEMALLSVGVTSQRQSFVRVAPGAPGTRPSPVAGANTPGRLERVWRG